MGIVAAGAPHGDDHLRRQLDDRLVGQRAEAVDGRRHVGRAGELEDRVGARVLAARPSRARSARPARTARAAGRWILALASSSALKSATTFAASFSPSASAPTALAISRILPTIPSAESLIGHLDVGHAGGLQRLDDFRRAGALGGQHQGGADRDDALARQRPHVADALLLLQRLGRKLAGGVDADDAVAGAERVDDLRHVAADRQDARGVARRARCARRRRRR